MIKEILQGKQALSLRQEVEEEEEEKVKKRQQFWMMMGNPDLSLGPSQFVIPENTSSLSSESETNPSKKRKYCLDHFKTDPMIQTSIELQLKDPLPFDWEQCLDLESGRMYYLNRSTLKKSWNCPKEQKLDLELNISPISSSSEGKRSSEILEGSKKYSSSYNNNNNMVAVACLKCHLLVMLSRSSPSCPNCKYVHSLATQQNPPPPKVTTIKSFDTLSLLNWSSGGKNDKHE
ncbi:uncharacterized protein LOC122671702 [Telopea speciosissima]|uniref:uncharacterized protein LOC122671702 n=1 Tax=Telopea speciosissima TaxID=54955 RepID=UPI001CC666B3|nr:uncharacterized protein LOC122671702 [Telopea speciosissima]